eukprot:GEMP01018956.1.p1 GENE.GEMP01018956.1~~GEMP01018956.1.p1  ORF type:complete len:410 (+),score=95.16 GEMP01018956.1:122-1351(+)
MVCGISAGAIRCIFFGVVCLQQLFLQRLLVSREMESDYVRESLKKTLTRNEVLFNEVTSLELQLMDCNRRNQDEETNLAKLPASIPAPQHDQRVTSLQQRLMDCKRRNQDAETNLAKLRASTPAPEHDATVMPPVALPPVASEIQKKLREISVVGSLEQKVSADFIVGIPSVMRKKKTYLIDTLDLIFNGSILNPEELTRIAVVVHLGDPEMSIVTHAANGLRERYQPHVASSRLHVIHALPEMYPPLDICPPDCTFNDEPLRVRWRTKQNIDYAWLMDFASALGSASGARFYMQLEDDIDFQPNWVTKATTFIQEKFDPVTYRSKKENAPWSMIDFGELGFIGKAFQMRTLPRLSGHLRLYYDLMPCDLLLNSWLGTMLQPKRIQYFLRKGPLFRHVGVYRSLGGVQL